MTLIAVPTKSMSPTERIRYYNQSIYNLDSALRTVDSTLAAMRGGQKPDWRQVAQETGLQLDAAMTWLNSITHTGLGDFDVPIAMPVQRLTSWNPTMGPNTALTPQGMTLPGAASEGGPQLTTLAARIRQTRYLVVQMRDAELAKIMRGQVGLGRVITDCFGQPLPATPAQRLAAQQRWQQAGTLGTFDPTGTLVAKYAGILAIRAALAAACAYHGYGRNGTVGGALEWALWPLLFGFTGGGIALAIAVNQGFGKPIPKPTP